MFQASHSKRSWLYFTRYLTEASDPLQNTNHQQMHKESYIVNRNTLLHVSTLLGHLQGELSVTVTLGLHFIVE
jgi:hypothetical protein